MIVAGFGFRSSATAESIRSALRLAARDCRVAALAVPVDKAEADCLAAVASELAVPVVRVDDADLAAAQTATSSGRVLAARCVGSVAEAAALAAAGPGARLLSAREISEDRLAACAVATGESL